ncbi:hypothetical protein PENTCL1PPCAC_15341, partial [Pristionchus entomophagus]
SVACLTLALIALADAETGKDYGISNWKCDAEVMKKSKTKPTSVHSLRYADINIIAALGDSLTAANGAGAPDGDLLGVAIQYRGLAFGIGGDMSLDEHVTLTNVLRKFNPDLFGYSIKTGSASVWDIAHLNAAIPGALSHGLVDQANDLVNKMKTHSEIDVQSDWKLVHIFIGGNDICHWCKHADGVSAEHYRDNIGAAVQILKDNLPKTVVVLVGMFDLSLLRKIDKEKHSCYVVHEVECPCDTQLDYSNDDITAECGKYQTAQEDLMDGRFEADDFSLVIQPFLEEIHDPPSLPNGEPDLNYFAPDCFHFSQFGHGVVAKSLWNNLVQPVGAKDRYANLTDLTPPLACPDKACPFLRTSKNSVDCGSYMTPAEN